MLMSAVEGAASLRFYGWSEPVLSLGYFQPEQARRQDSILAQLPFVRRPSGGKALVHHHELTYALALPAGSPWQTGETRGVKWIRRMHTILAAALDTLGVAACFPPPQSNQPVLSPQPLSPAVGGQRSEVRGQKSEIRSQPRNQPLTDLCPLTSDRRGERAGRFLCFEYISPDDLLVGADKIAGRRNAASAALLQHGAVLLAASPHTPHLAGIHELTGLLLTANEISPALTKEFSRQTECRVIASDWTATERQRMDMLVTTRYTQNSWTRKR